MFERGEILVKIGLAGAFLTLIGSYAAFELQDLVNGPQIAVASPQNGATLSRSLVEVAGVAQNVSDISLNGKKIFITEEGAFSEKLLLSYGYNVITIQATDRFGREVERQIEVVYK